MLLSVRLIRNLKRERLKGSLKWRIAPYIGVRILACDPLFLLSLRVVPRGKLSRSLSGFARGYCGSVIYDEGMRKEFLWQETFRNVLLERQLENG